MVEDYITNCTACSKGLTRENLKYENGLAFHPECFEQWEQIPTNCSRFNKQNFKTKNSDNSIKKS